MSDAKEQLKARVNAELQGMTSRHGLLKMLDADTPTVLSQCATEHYQDGPAVIGEIVEAMIAAGIVVPATTSRWWPSRLSALRVLLAARSDHLTVRGNPPAVRITDIETGNTGYAEISEATAEAIDAAKTNASATLATRRKRTKRQLAAERSVDAS